MTKEESRASTDSQSQGKGRKNRDAGLRLKDLKSSLRDQWIALKSISENRKETVGVEIIEGSTPHLRYYILLSISALIAAIGLVTNSPAVVIGAMLISPLMTPIFGICFALIRWNVPLLRQAIISEFGGVALAIFVSALLGLLPFNYSVTPEMLARTNPTLLDLGVAALAGIAGCLAMIDEKISPVLPGIAMATALTPPLATSGLCIALGAYHGAWVLTNTLAGVVDEWKTSEKIKDVLETELSEEPSTAIENVIFKKKEGKVDILATVRSPRVLSPYKVEQIQNLIAKNLGMDTRVIVRCDITKDISAWGSTSVAVSEDLDGEFITTELNPKVKRIQLSEQALREALEGYPGLILKELNVINLKHGALILATIESSKDITPSMVAKLEKMIQKKMKDPMVRFLVRSQTLRGVTSKGRVLYGKAHFGEWSPADRALQKKIEEGVKKEIRQLGNIFVTSIDALKKKGKWLVLVKVVGTQIPKPSQVQDIEEKIAKATLGDITITIWSDVEVMVTRDEYLSRDAYSEKKQMNE
jgi:uncharacterized hydrophobic protein (TIGR00271 family)